MAKEEIYKLQLPIISTEAEPAILAYNKDRSSECHVYMSKDTIEDVFPNGELKVYCLCSISPEGSFLIGDRVEDQEW